MVSARQLVSSLDWDSLYCTMNNSVLSVKAVLFLAYLQK